MSKPPSSPTDSLLLSAMREGINYRFKIRCRGLEFTARPLSCFEVVRATQEVADQVEELEHKYRNSITESLWMASKKLQKATTTDVGSNDPKLTDYEIERMTPDEIDYLWKQYVAGCAKVNPCLEEMANDDILALVSQVKKSPNLGLALIDLSFLELANICRRLLTTTEDSPTDKLSG